MIRITLLYFETTFPANQSYKVGKTYIEWLKDNPPDNTISKVLCIGVFNTEDGDMKTIGISRIMPGKEKEAFEINSKLGLFSSDKIEGYKFKSRLMWDFPEAYKIIGMTAPQV